MAPAGCSQKYSSVGGPGKAPCYFALLPEQCVLKKAQMWGSGLEFEKLFNKLSPGLVARCAGLGMDTIELLLSPLLHSQGIWRLPFGAMGRVFRNRGRHRNVCVCTVSDELSYLFRYAHKAINGK